MVNKKIVGVLGLASVALVGGTFAYFTQTATIDNPFDTARYSTFVTEDFMPEDGENWQPGAEVNKDLYVENTGDRNVVVRVKFEDFWFRGNEMTDDNTFIHVEDLAEKGATKQPVGDESFQEEPEDGKTKKDGVDDGTVVFKTFEGMGDWTYHDGFYYYNKPVKPGESTGKFLDKVQLDPKVDMGKFNTAIFAKVAAKTENPANELDIPEDTDGNLDDLLKAKGWVYKNTEPGKVAAITPLKLEEYNTLAKAAGMQEYTKENMIANNLGIFTGGLVRPEKEDGKTLEGYSNAKYILRITVQTVQATDEAVKNVFFNGNVPAELNGLYTGTDEATSWNLDKEALE